MGFYDAVGTYRKDKRIVHTSVLVAGIEVFVYYRSDKVNPFLERETAPVDKVKFLFFIHGRTECEAELEYLLMLVLQSYYEDEDHDPAPLIIFSWDQRNHGTRIVDEFKNEGWSSGNDTHAMDMISCVDGGVLDLKNIVDYIPAYLPGYRNFKNVIRIVAGVSMGGHISIRAVANYPGLFHAAIPIIGCFDLTTLMMKRLEPNLKGVTLFIHSYGILKHTMGEKHTKYPQELFDITSREDSHISRFYDTKQTKTLALFGAEDNLVPFRYSIPFIEAIGEDVVDYPPHIDTNKTFQAYKYPCGHAVTTEMLQHITEFLLGLFDPSISYA
ncbi:CYFA0S14e00980g1_1 [Cyberlindnera fabianii]|uniref:CYFA0S14e00980g1_1 n=1 Tax=Cyberlindnera fabianii TaxID=36022 RepID=A0A061BBA3_CYBFA|nr:hypothetical protein BON22_3988 [Cyberlindnera fabianii]CDR44221.1 CYFA0S14e00980g1_1 [Cyberlindnera fabianii]